MKQEMNICGSGCKEDGCLLVGLVGDYMVVQLIDLLEPP